MFATMFQRCCLTILLFLPPAYFGPASLAMPPQNRPAHVKMPGDSLSALVFKPSLGRLVGNPHYFLEHRELAHPRVGLALSGGGARCLAQIGVLQALEENHVPIDFIAGTSMGSFIGGLYAAGYSAAQLREIVQGIDWDEIMTDETPRKNLLLSQKQEREGAILQVRFRGLQPNIPRALTAGQKLHSILTELTWRANYWASASFDNMRIAFRAIATDVYSGKEVVIDSGDLSEAMRASAAMPLLLAPVPKQNLLLIDGGVSNNLPVDVVRRHGVEIVIAVDATSNLRPKTNLSSPWEFADQVTTIMQQEHTNRQRQAADVLISLEGEARTSLDFTDLDSLIDLGYRLTMAKMENIRWLYNHRFAGAKDFESRAVAVNHVRVAGNGAHIANAENLRNGAAATAMADIQMHVDRLYGSGDYAEVQARLRHDTLTFELQVNPRLNEVFIIGNTIYPDSTLLACLKTKRGEIINHQQGKADLTAIVEHYRRDGYALAEIRQVSFDSTTGNLQITIDEGHIGQIAVEGLNHTREMVVLREFSLKAGEIFDSKRARRGIDNIHSTGLFESVRLAPLRMQAGGALIKIKVEEKPYGILRLGGYYQSERGGNVLLEAGNDNMFGIGSKLFLHGNLGSRDGLAKLSWRSDRIFRTFLTMSTDAYYQTRENFTYPEGGASAPIGEYSERRLGVRLLVGQQVRRLGAASAELRSERVSLHELAGTGYPVGKFGFTALALRSIVDTRDQLPFARAGRLVHVYYEYAKPLEAEEESFVKFFSRLESYHSFGPHTAHTRLMLGIADQTTPFSEQFRLSGPKDVFGLKDQELVGRHLVLGSLEYRYQMRRRPLFDTYFSLRYDLYGLWEDQKQTSYRKFRHAGGIAATLDTPIGTIGLALGLLEGGRTQAYFNVGVPF